MLHRVVGERVKGEKSRKNTVSVIEGFWKHPLAKSNAVGLVTSEDFGVADRKRRLAFIYGLGIAAYPFLGVIATNLGRLLRLHEQARADQLRQRMVDQFGDKRQIEVALGAALQSFCDWGIIERRESAYIATSTIPIADPEIAGWLLLSAMLAEGKRVALSSALQVSAMLFPFKLRAPTATGLARSFPVHVMSTGQNDELLEIHD